MPSATKRTPSLTRLRGTYPRTAPSSMPKCSRNATFHVLRNWDLPRASSHSTPWTTVTSSRFWGNPAGIPYAFNSLHRAGIKLLMGSDAPVAPLDPWLAISAAVFGTESSDREPFQSEQCLEFRNRARFVHRPGAYDVASWRCGGPSAAGLRSGVRLSPPEAMRAMPDHVLATMLAGCWTYPVSRISLIDGGIGKPPDAISLIDGGASAS